MPALHRSNAFPSVRAECHAARNTVGTLDISSFAKYEITGPVAAMALGRLLAARLPMVGCTRLTPMLAHSGRLMGDLTTMLLPESRFWIFGCGYLQTWHRRWFSHQLVRAGTTVRNLRHRQH